jgi:hypothetical protein
MRMTTINQETKRPALGSCFAHGSDRLAKVWSISGERRNNRTISAYSPRSPEPKDLRASCFWTQETTGI